MGVQMPNYNDEDDKKARQILDSSQDALLNELRNLVAQLREAQAKYERMVMLHTSLESEYWAKRTECDELLATCDSQDHIVLEAEELREALSLYRSMVLSGEDESEVSKTMYDAAVRVRVHDKPQKPDLAKILEDAYREGHCDGHYAGGQISYSEDDDWKDSGTRVKAEGMK